MGLDVIWWEWNCSVGMLINLYFELISWTSIKELPPTILYYSTIWYSAPTSSHKYKEYSPHVLAYIRPQYHTIPASCIILLSIVKPLFDKKKAYRYIESITFILHIFLQPSCVWLSTQPQWDFNWLTITAFGCCYSLQYNQDQHPWSYF